MAHLWQVGDKAVCVDATTRRSTVSPLVEDKIYVIEGFRTDPSGDLGLFLQGVERGGRGRGWYGFCAKRFRPVLPDKHEPASDAEFLGLMGAIKAKTRQVVKV